MADEFDPRAAAEGLAQLVSSTSAEVRQVLPPATPEPLFHKLPDGSVTDRRGRVVLPAQKPAAAK
jgi:hypothetical protein